MFRVYDDDDTGRVTAQNLRRCADELKEDVLEVTQEHIDTMISMADKGRGYVQLDDFVNLMIELGLIAERNPIEEMAKEIKHDALEAEKRAFQEQMKIPS